MSKAVATKKQAEIKKVTPRVTIVDEPDESDDLLDAIAPVEAPKAEEKKEEKRAYNPLAKKEKTLKRLDKIIKLLAKLAGPPCEQKENATTAISTLEEFLVNLPPEQFRKPRAEGARRGGRQKASYAIGDVVQIKEKRHDEFLVRWKVTSLGELVVTETDGDIARVDGDTVLGKMVPFNALQLVRKA